MSGLYLNLPLYPPAMIVFETAPYLKKELPMDEFENGWISIARTSQYANMARKIDVFVDEIKVGNLGNGERKVFELEPGLHRVHAKIDWCMTPPVEVEIIAGETIDLYCGSEMKGLKILLSIAYLFSPDRWIYLRRQP